MRKTRLYAAILCAAMLLTLMPVTTLAAEMFDVTVTAGENGTITIGDAPQQEGETDTRVYFRSDTESQNISIEANDGGADFTPVPIAVLPDPGYEIDSVTLGGTVLEVGDSIGENPPFTVRKDGFGGRILGSFLKIPDTGTYVVSATFKEEEEGPGGGEPGGEEPGGGDQGNEFYTITLSVGANGSVTVTRKVAEEDVPVEPDEEDDNTYTVPAGSDVTFTFVPADGYIVDQLRVDDRPEWTDQNNKFTIFNVRSSQLLEITFIEAEEFTITVPQVENVTMAVYKNGEQVDFVDNQFTSLTRDMVRYYFMVDSGCKLNEFCIQQDNGYIEGIFTFYDPVAGMFYADVETNFNYTLIVEAEVPASLPTPYYAILASEANGDESVMKAAIRRELGLQGLVISDEDLTITADTPPDTVTGATYKVTVAGLGDAYFYTVANAKTLLILNEPTDGDKALTIHDGSGISGFEPVTIIIPAITSGKIYALGPYSAFAMDMSHALGLNLPVSAEDDGAYNVTGVFYNMQWHVVNKGTSPETTINWYPTNVVTEDAIYIEAAAKKNGVTQMAGAWAIDTSPRVNSVDDDGTVNYRLEVFFGNDTVTISPPSTEGNVTGVAVRTASDSPGYTFLDESDTVKVIFHSDFYDNITVPLTLTLGDGTTKYANVAIHRVGVEIGEHIREDRISGDMSQIGHGTQNGSLVDLTDYGFRLTATYYIPDGGDIAPYGLFVTRTYSDGRVETETILVPIEGVFDHGNAASAVDYIIYSGTDAATAPVSVSVLVLKDEPGNNAFGGVSFGSGIGVTWTKQ